MRRVIVAILLVILASGCVTKVEPPQTTIDTCVNACTDALESNASLDAGPCLLDPIHNADWVCDVVHDPRQEVDNAPENQCQSYRNGTVKHFIELSPDCAIIRTE